MRWTQEDLDNYRAKLALTDNCAPRLIPMMPACLVPKAKRPKYGNRKVRDAEGNVHDSTKEFRRWQELQLREIAGEIRELRHHVPFACVVEGEHVFDYEADFVYREGAALIVEDTKPKDPKYRKTAAYRLFRAKQKVAQALHKFQIREI